MSHGITLPLRRERLAERSRLDSIEERAASSDESPSGRLMLALELSDLSRELATSASAAWLRKPRPLEAKVRVYVDPLLAVARPVR
jgi:hypothetical protein